MNLLKRIAKKLKNLFLRARLTINNFLVKTRVIADLNAFEVSIYSQNGEDGILAAIFSKIGTTNKFFVEFGVGNGSQCNTRLLGETKGWSGLLMDGHENNPDSIKKEFITAENINELFEKYKVPKSFDLLSIDIDGNDYWVWRALDERYVPRVLVIEYNASISIEESKTIKYDPKFIWDGTNYFGGSLLALTQLAKSKGYELLACDNMGVNAFFIRQELVHHNFIVNSLKEIYRSPQYGIKENGFGHPASQQLMIEV